MKDDLEARARAMRAEMYKEGENFDDAKALTLPEFYPFWKYPEDYKTGNRVRDMDVLYKCRQSHTSQSDWQPHLTPALWEEVAKPGQGDTPDDPIPYNNNMELFEGKYYSQFDVVYICTRSTGVAVYNNLADLVGLYVEVYAV